MALGDSIQVAGDWFYLHFIENPGMAFGLEFGGDWGKILLSSFRLVACVVIAYYLARLVRQKASLLFIFSVALIFSGALGNIIDSALYGLIFDKGSVWNGHYYEGYAGVAAFCGPSAGYTGFLTGNVVDMFYFPLIEGTWPEWTPWVGGERFIFFRSVFNIADAAISVGLGIIVLKQKSFFGKKAEEVAPLTSEEAAPAAPEEGL